MPGDGPTERTVEDFGDSPTTCTLVLRHEQLRKTLEGRFNELSQPGSGKVCSFLTLAP
jgi:hypothetical protein